MRVDIRRNAAWRHVARFLRAQTSLAVGGGDATELKSIAKFIYVDLGRIFITPRGEHFHAEVEPVSR